MPWEVEGGENMKIKDRDYYERYYSQIVHVDNVDQ